MVVRGVNPFNIVAPDFEAVHEARERAEQAMSALRDDHLAVEKNSCTTLNFEREDLEIDLSLSRHETQLIGGVISELSTCFDVLDESGDSIASMNAHISSMPDSFGIVLDGHTYNGPIAQQIALGSVLLAVGSLWEQSNNGEADANLQAQLTETEAVIRACMTGEAALDDRTQVRLMNIGQSALSGIWSDFGHLHGWASASFTLASHGPLQPTVYNETNLAPYVAPKDEKGWSYVPILKQTAIMQDGATLKHPMDVMVERGVLEVDDVSAYLVCRERLVMNAGTFATIEQLDAEGEVSGFRIATNADIRSYTAPLTTKR